MSKAKCPGQDTRYWKPGDIFSLQCGKCGKSIEFFKDDVSRKCPECGIRVQNPKITIGCAMWCEHAAGCLGYDPRTAVTELQGEASEKSVIKKILYEISERYGKESSIYHNAEILLEQAVSMLKGETSNPKIVLPAALMLAVESDKSVTLSENLNSSLYKNKSFPAAGEILTDAGIDDNIIDEICELISSVIDGENIESREFAIVRECYNSLHSRGIN